MTHETVILSETSASQREADVKSKDPFHLDTLWEFAGNFNQP